MKVAWVTDSTAFVDETVKVEIAHLYIIPMTILIDGVEYKDGEDLSPEALFEKLRDKKVDVKTSQPAIGTFQSLYTKLSEEFDHIFSIHVSSHFSGTFSSAFQAAQLLKANFPQVTVVDSKIISYPLTELIRYGNQLVKQGKKPDEVKRLVEKRIATSEAYVMVGSLEQLHRSGRMNGLSFFIGSVLNIKPILSINDGQLNVKEKVRNTNKGFLKMLEYLDGAVASKTVQHVSVLHGLNKKEANEWIQQLKLRYKGIAFNAYPLGAVIGVHAGENTIGISWFDSDS
ncbi:DegV family protein [Bacillus seohaeanensis]|uniref:DegV family protein n=1 Tax=Bacillus seohaeanensis TaxID=284580 RepID=A0ABW5RQ70_9BACI